LLFSKTADLIR